MMKPFTLLCHLKFAGILFTVWLGFVFNCAQAEEALSQEEIKQLVKQLGSGGFEERETASQKLWEAGETAREALEKASESDDGEVSFRARVILKKLDFGILHDTPPEIVALLEHYPTASVSEKVKVVQRLISANQVRTVMRLFNNERDEKTKAMLLRSVLPSTGKLVAPLLSEGRIDEARDVLALAAESNSSELVRNYAAFLFFRGELDAEIDRYREIVNKQPELTSKKIVLAKLLITRGDIEEARAYLKKNEKKYSPENSSLADILYRQQDFQTLADKTFIPGDQGLEHEGFAATFHRLAGNHDESDQAIQNLKQLAAEKPDSTYMICEGLMINDRWDDAIELFVTADRETTVMQIQMERGKIDEAFKIAGIDDPRGGKVVEWLKEETKDLDVDSKEFNSMFFRTIALVEMLNRLSDREQVIEIMKLLKSKIGDNRYRITELLSLQRKTGHSELAKKYATELLADNAENADPVWRGLVDKNQSYAILLHEFLKESQWKLSDADDTSGEPLVLVDRTYKSFRPRQTELLGEDQTKALIANIADYVDSKDGLSLDDNLRWKGLAAMLCGIHGHMPLRVELLEEIHELRPDENSTRIIADAFLRIKKWKQAADWYEKLSEIDSLKDKPERSTVLLLQGIALKKSGDIANGQKAIDQSNLLALGDTALRGATLRRLDELQQMPELLEQAELILRFGSFSAWEGSSAWAVQSAGHYLARFGNLPPDQAAFHFERQIVYLLKTNTAYQNVIGYCHQTHKIHSLKALHLIHQKEFDAAFAEASLALDARIDQTEGSIQLVQAFDRAGRKDLADKLYKRVHSFFTTIIGKYPDAEHYLNNSAWASANCDRDLDEALDFAKRAVARQTLNPSYMDTLGEVHFRRGEFDEAIRWEQRAIAAAPGKKEYELQLEKFQAAKDAE